MLLFFLRSERWGNKVGCHGHWDMWLESSGYLYKVTHVFTGRHREAHETPVAVLYFTQIGMYEEIVHSHMCVDGFRDLNYLCTTLMSL